MVMENGEMKNRALVQSTNARPQSRVARRGEDTSSSMVERLSRHTLHLQ
jgi:hypothetical protein